MSEYFILMMMGNLSFFICRKYYMWEIYIIIECSKLNWKGKYANGLCVYIFFKSMRWYLEVIVKLHNYECVTYIFTGEALNGTQNVFNKSQYHFWYKESRNQILPVIINTTHEHCRLKIKVKGTFL